MTRVRCAACQEEGRDGCKLCGLLSFTKATWKEQTMTTDPDKILADLHRRLSLSHTRLPENQALGDVTALCEVLAATRRELAEARLAVTTLCDAHRETRRLVDALAGPMRIEHGKMRFYVNGREVEGVERGGGMIEIPLEPADVASDELRVEPAPRPTDDSPEAWRASIRAALPPTQVFAFDRHDFVECYPCACKPGMPTLCAHCLANRATISALRAALREVIDDAAGLFTGMRSGVWQKPSDSKLDSKLARLAELRRLL